MTAVVPMLEDSLVWSTTGHLAEAAIAALVDGEGVLLPEHAVQHAVTCAACCEQVGLAALFALEVDEALSSSVLGPAPQLAAQPLLSSLAPGGTGRFDAARHAARHQANNKSRVPGLPPLAPLPMMVPALCVVLALAAGAPLLSTLRESSLAHLLAKLARIIARATLAARAPGIAELTWLAAALLVIVGVSIAHGAARVRSHMGTGLP